MKDIFKFSFFLILSIALYSCTTTKTFTSKTIKQLDHSEILDSISSTNGDYKTFYSKLSINLKAEKSLNLKGTVKLTKDSVIWISLSPGLGFEVARIMLKPDSVFVLDRVRNTYYYGTYSYFKQLADVDVNFNTLQALLLNELFIYNTDQSDTSVFSSMIITSDKINNKIKLQSLRNRDLRKLNKKDQQSDQLYQDIIINNDWKIESSSITDFKFDRKMNIKYSDYVNNETFLSPSNLHIRIYDADKEINVDLEYYKTTFDKDNKYPFSIPTKYDQVRY